MSRAAVKGLNLFRLCSVIAAVIFSANAFGRDMTYSYSGISFSPDGNRLLFNRCDGAATCAIHLYEIDSGKLGYYLAPENEVWGDGKFSNDGRSIVLTVTPVENEKRVFERIQLATMRPDGRGFQMLTTSPGVKVAPSFSTDDHTILYASAAILRKEGSTPATAYGVYEYDIQKKEEHLLTDVRFYQVSPPQYLNAAGDVVFSAVAPLWGPQGNPEEIPRERLYTMKFESSMYRISPGQHELTPWFIFGGGVYYPVVASTSHRFFFVSVSDETHGYECFEFIEKGHYRKITHLGMLAVWSVDASPDGKRLAIVFSTQGGRKGPRRIGLVNTEDGTFTELEFPTPRIRIN